MVEMVVLLTEVVEPLAVSHMVPQAELEMELEAMVAKVVTHLLGLAVAVAELVLMVAMQQLLLVVLVEMELQTIL
jgi:hypothetical protein